MYLWLIHIDAWQTTIQYCKAIILQLKINENQNKKEPKKQAPFSFTSYHCSPHKPKFPPAGICKLLPDSENKPAGWKSEGWLAPRRRGRCGGKICYSHSAEGKGGDICQGEEKPRSGGWFSVNSLLARCSSLFHLRVEEKLVLNKTWAGERGGRQ